MDARTLTDLQETQKAIDARRAALGIPTAPENSLISKLKAVRRLSAATIELFNIEPHKYGYQWGWRYPTPAGGERWKNANSNAEPKYTWIGGKPEGASLYHASDLHEAIAAAGGVVWFTTEADVWTLREAGISNAFSTFSETIILDNLGDMLVTMGVTRVLIAPDLDPTGQGSAERIRAALWGSTIELTCYQLPARLEEHGDIGKAWQEYHQPEPFAFWLASLPLVEIAEPASVHVTPAPVYFGDDPLLEIKQQVTAALGVRGFNADGFNSYKNICCRFHDDKTASASLHRDKGLYCHRCGKTYTWKELASNLGIDWTFKNTVTITALPVGIVGLCREAKAEMVTMGLTNLSRALDLLIDADRAGEEFTLEEFTAFLSPYIKPYTARVIFETIRGKHQPIAEEKSFGGFFSFLYSLQHIEGKKTLKNSKRGRKEGRPTATAKTPTAAQINQLLGITNPHYYSVTPAIFSDAKLYRAALLHDVIRRKPGKYSRRYLSKLCGGISFPTISKYCELLGIERITQPPKQTKLTPEQLMGLPADYRELRLMVMQNKIPPHVFLMDERGKRHSYSKTGAQRAAMYGGGILYRAEWQKSEYRLKGQGIAS
jgi:hypothetical protein